jgi:hypothetical protein
MFHLLAPKLASDSLGAGDFQPLVVNQPTVDALNQRPSETVTRDQLLHPALCRCS